VNGVAKPAGFDLKSVPTASIVRIEVSERGSPEAAAEGATPQQTVVNIVTRT
jgi:outer membrane receptor for ferrienterochelin and colicin